MGADWIGLNFHPASPRYVRPDEAAEIIAALPASAAAVGVFVDRPAAEVAEAAERLGLRIVQLHGQEPPEDLVALDRFQVVRAFRLDRAAAWSGVTEYLEPSPGARALAGRGSGRRLRPRQSGGTGTTIAHRASRSAPPAPPDPGRRPDAENVAERIARARPWMVDVASGVEKAPGRKDLARVAASFARFTRRLLRSGSYEDRATVRITPGVLQLEAPAHHRID